MKTNKAEFPKSAASAKKCAQQRLVRKIETLAIRQRLSMSEATKRVINDPTYWELLSACVSMNARTPRPRARSIRSWMDRERIAFAKTWPDVLPPEMSHSASFDWLEAYIPVRRRYHSRHKIAKQQKAALMLDEGATRASVAKELSVSRSTLYRWCPPKKPEGTI